MEIKMKKHKLYKERRINDIENKSTLSERDVEFLATLSKSNNALTRNTAAELLVKSNTAQGEDILYSLSFDKNILVKMNAIDSLCIGRTLKSLQRLMSLSYDRDYLIRGYALLSHYEVYLNYNKTYGNECKIKSYSDNLKNRIADEDETWVKVVMYEIMYNCGSEDALNEIISILNESIEIKDYEVVWEILHTFEDIIEDKNKKSIENTLKHIYMLLLPAQKDYVNEIFGKII